MAVAKSMMRDQDFPSPKGRVMGRMKMVSAGGVSSGKSTEKVGGHMKEAQAHHKEAEHHMKKAHHHMEKAKHHSEKAMHGHHGKKHHEAKHAEHKGRGRPKKHHSAY
jgi:hypothetical protein